MKGHIKNLGKNRKKTYFFIKGEDGNSYFANISDVESDGAPKATNVSVYMGRRVRREFYC